MPQYVNFFIQVIKFSCHNASFLIVCHLNPQVIHIQPRKPLQFQGFILSFVGIYHKLECLAKSSKSFTSAMKFSCWKISYIWNLLHPTIFLNNFIVKLSALCKRCFIKRNTSDMLKNFQFSLTELQNIKYVFHSQSVTLKLCVKFTEVSIEISKEH